MNNPTRILIMACLLSLHFSSSFSQTFKDRYYQSLGWTVLLDGYLLPTYYTSENSTSDAGGYSLVTGIYKARVNVYDFNDNTSLDVHLIPAIGLGLTETEEGEIWFGCFSLPLMGAINFGNVSTYTTKQNHGFGLGVGMEYFNGGLIVTNQSSGSRKTSVFQPALDLSYRYWSKKNKAKELSLFVGYRGQGASEVNSSVHDVHGSVHIRFSWSTYIDY